MTWRTKLVAMAWVTAAAAAGCTSVPKNVNDTTPPTVEIKTRAGGGAYAPATTASMGAVDGSLDIMCTASDPDGVSSIALDFSGHSDGCNVGGSSYIGSFPIEPVPAPLQQTLKGDAQGNVLTSLPLLATLRGPFGCKVLGNPTQQGVPYGGKITVTCTGRNWASNAQTKTSQQTLTVTLQ